MAKCEVCGNDYYLSFEVVAAGQRHVFDSFECAIHKLAPVCAHCSVKVIGHGVEGKNEIYCCANCARQAGLKGVADRAGRRIYVARAEGTIDRRQWHVYVHPALEAGGLLLGHDVHVRLVLGAPAAYDGTR